MLRKQLRILDLEKLLIVSRRPFQVVRDRELLWVVLSFVVPKVFLMDEPLSNFDAKLRVQMRSEIASLHNRLKATIIYVTHDQTEALTLGTRIVILRRNY